MIQKRVLKIAGNVPASAAPWTDASPFLEMGTSPGLLQDGDEQASIR
jgi:hypothetical protein